MAEKTTIRIQPTEYKLGYRITSGYYADDPSALEEVSIGKVIKIMKALEARETEFGRWTIS